MQLSVNEIKSYDAIWLQTEIYEPALLLVHVVQYMVCRLVVLSQGLRRRTLSGLLWEILFKI